MSIKINISLNTCKLGIQNHYIQIIARKISLVTEMLNKQNYVSREETKHLKIQIFVPISPQVFQGRPLLCVKVPPHVIHSVVNKCRTDRETAPEWLKLLHCLIKGMGTYNGPMSTCIIISLYF